jgi:hypothetical protein
LNDYGGSLKCERGVSQGLQQRPQMRKKAPSAYFEFYNLETTPSESPQTHQMSFTMISTKCRRVNQRNITYKYAFSFVHVKWDHLFPIFKFAVPNPNFNNSSIGIS